MANNEFDNLLTFIEPLKNLNVNDIKYTNMDYDYPDIVNQFQKAVYSSSIKDLNYVKNMESNGWNDLDIMKRDIPKMTISEIGTCLTAIVRKEKFCAGSLVSMLKNGIIVKLLERLKECVSK